MDTSKEYIEMCEKALFIQAHVNVTEDIAYAQKWINHNEVVEYVFRIGEQKFIYDQKVELSAEKKAEWPQKDRYIQDLIWIPRQDQIQFIIMKYTHKDIWQIIQEFATWCVDNRLEMGVELISVVFTSVFSMEQLWLMFAMNYLYHCK